MTALEQILAWESAENAGRELVTEAGLLLEVREGAAVSRYLWTAGELTGIVEPDGSRWDYHYGEDGRLLRVARNGSPWAEYHYDASGRLAEISRPDHPAAHLYDEEGRLLRTLRGDATPFLYSWEDGRVVRARSDREESRFRYDALGRVTGIEQLVDGIAVAMEFRFDGAGRLAAVRFPGWGQGIEFSWDERGRPASIAWNGREASRFGTNDRWRYSWSEAIDGVREETWHEPAGGRPSRKIMSRHGDEFWRCDFLRDEAFRLTVEGARSHSYDAWGRLSETREGSTIWSFSHDDMDQPVVGEESGAELRRDAAGRLCYLRRGAVERVLRHNQAGELLELLADGSRVARCLYDHKGRLALKEGASGTERYLYGPDDGVLAIADGEGKPLVIFLRLPTGIVGMIDFRSAPQGEVIAFHCDAGGNLVFAGTADGELQGPFASDPYGVPLQPSGRVPYLYRGRLWHPDLSLYRIGCRWYDPMLRQFLTPDSHTGAPDDERLVNPFIKAAEQRPARLSILGEWLRQPRLRNRYAYCANDPVNRFDPDGHWSFGAFILSLLGVLWTLPNTVFGLAIEVSCLVGEVIRWLAWLFSGGKLTWQTPGFDAASSGRLNAFALVCKGGWFGSFQGAIDVLAMTFGNVIFLNDQYQSNPFWQALPDPVTPPAYGGSESIPKSQALYEHELRHVNQYGWWGPFFHLGLPLFGVYEWDVILNGYYNAGLEKDARDHGGF